MFYTLEELCQMSLKSLDSEQLLAVAQEMQDRLQTAQDAPGFGSPASG